MLSARWGYPSKSNYRRKSSQRLTASDLRQAGLACDPSGRARVVQQHPDAAHWPADGRGRRSAGGFVGRRGPIICQGHTGVGGHAIRPCRGGRADCFLFAAARREPWHHRCEVPVAVFVRERTTKGTKSRRRAGSALRSVPTSPFAALRPSVSGSEPAPSTAGRGAGGGHARRQMANGEAQQTRRTAAAKDVVVGI